MAKKKYGSDLIVDVIKRYDLDYVTFNPGSSFRGLHDSLVHYGANIKPEVILCPHENTAIGIAHGYAIAAEKPMVVILHNLVGLLHGTMAIYYAYTDRVPMIIAGATGPMDVLRRRPHIDWIHTALVQGNAIRDYVKWDDQPYSIAAVPEAFARAYRIANTEPKGPTYICFDVTLQEEVLEDAVPLPNVKRLMPPTPIQAEPAALQKAADLLVKAKRPVILAGTLGRKKASVSKLTELCELLSIPVIDLKYRFNFPNTHPMDLTGSDCLKTADVLLALDVRDLAGPTTNYESVMKRTTRLQSILPGDCKVIEMGFSDLEISSWSTDYEKIQEVDLSVLCDTSVALPELIKECRETLSKNGGRNEPMDRRFKTLGEMHTRIRDGWRAEAHKDWELKPMTVPRLVSEVWEVIKNEDWVLTVGTRGANDWPRKLWDWDEPYRFGGKEPGTAMDMNLSLGMALAHKGTGRLVVDIQPDGDLLYNPAALWVASHHRIPMLVVMLNNRAYSNSLSHQVTMAKRRGHPADQACVGTEINHPPPDFAKIAESFGWYSEGPIEDGNHVQDAVKRAIRIIRKEGRPALIDTVVQPS